MRRWVFPSQLRSPREGGREAPGEAAHLRGRAGPGGGLAPRPAPAPPATMGGCEGGGPCSRNASSSRLSRDQPPSCERLEQSGGGGGEGGGGGGREPAKRSGLELMMKAARPCADRLLSIPRSHGHRDTHRARPRYDPGGDPRRPEAAMGTAPPGGDPAERQRWEERRCAGM
ncbi:hypothetical protein Nmel_005968 [Mimus melanotis]